MAYDKVVDSAVLDAGLKQIADAIREKGGTSDTLAFPTAMAEAIAAIQAGGGGEASVAKGTITIAEQLDCQALCRTVVNHNLGRVPTHALLLNLSKEHKTSASTGDTIILYADTERVYGYQGLGATSACKVVHKTGIRFEYTSGSVDEIQSYIFPPVGYIYASTARAGETYLWMLW